MASDHVGKMIRKGKVCGGRDFGKGTLAKLTRTSEAEITGFLWENAVCRGFWRLLLEQKD